VLIYNVIKKNNMKLRSIVITIIASLLISGTIQAQGIYSNMKSSSDNSSSSSSVYSSGPMLRDESGDGFGDGGSGDGKDPDPGGPSDRAPIGEGLLILSLLSGAYAIVKRNLKNKHEN
jgi:hypothetical protein